MTMIRRPGDLTQYCLKVLRDAEIPMTTDEIVDRMAERQQFDCTGKLHIRDAWGPVVARLRSLEMQGLLETGGTGQCPTWTLAYPSHRVPDAASAK